MQICIINKSLIVITNKISQLRSEEKLLISKFEIYRKQFVFTFTNPTKHIQILRINEFAVSYHVCVKRHDKNIKQLLELGLKPIIIFTWASQTTDDYSIKEISIFREITRDFRSKIKQLTLKNRRIGSFSDSSSPRSFEAKELENCASTSNERRQSCNYQIGERWQTWN